MNSNNQWLDPLYLDSFLNEDEKLIRENTKKYCQKNLLPKVVENNRNYYFDKEIYKDFGKMGFLGSTIKGFAAICKGDYDHLPEAAFYMVGTIEEAIEKGEKMEKEAAA